MCGGGGVGEGGGFYKGIVSPWVGDQKNCLLVLIVYLSLPVRYMCMT